MAENYKEFDKSPIIDTSDVLIKGFRFRVRELALGIAVVVCLLVIIILAALLGTANSSGSNNNNVGGNSSAQTGGAGCQNQCFTPPCLKTAAHVTELVDTRTQPCDDFHTFACGHFPELHPLVPTEQGMSTFQLIYDKNQERLRRLLEQQMDPDQATPQNYERKMRHFFQSCQDHYQKMKLQGKPLLEQIVTPSGGWWGLKGDQWDAGRYDFQHQLEKVHVEMWTDAFFTFIPITDWVDWNNMTVQISLSGTGLHYSYYTQPSLSRYLPDYKKYIRAVGGLMLRDADLGLDDPEKTHRLETFATDAFFVESELARLKAASRPTESPHEPENRMTLAELNTMSDGALDWVSLFTHMFNDAPVDSSTHFVVLEKEYVAKFSKWIKDLPSANKSRILNNYLVWRLADNYDQDLSWDYIHANRQIYVDITGRAEFLGTWRYCVYKVDRDMKEALGALFIKNHFSQENKKTAHRITRYVKDALLKSLQDSTWMSETTKPKAIKKLNDSITELGYPEYMTDPKQLNAMYSKLDIDNTDYMKNVLSFNKFYRADWNRRLKYPNDRTIWPYAAYDFVAHYYSPWKQLFIPAGLLQFPIYDHTSPRYTNYGSMGTILGRQLIHAVDEYGNQYSLSGSGLETWWSNATTKRYQELKNCSINSLRNYTMGPYLLNGQLRKLPVNIGYSPLALSESSSVRLAYRAYQSWVDETGGDKAMPGAQFTNKQMFFISYAQTYCRTRDSRQELIRVLNQGKPPERIRVNAALAHVPEFQEAFQCSANSKMVAPKRCNMF